MRFLFAAVWHWRPSRLLVLGLALALQLGCILAVFGQFLLEPGQHLLVDTYDGAKNYYTFQAYVQQPWSNGLRWFGQMNYPYGDYVFYTDNTPLLSVPIRLWSHYISDLTPYALDIYHALFFAGFLISTGFLIAILGRLLRSWALVLIFSVVLPWINPQTSRLFVGHFNLSYSWVILLAVWGLLRLYEEVQAGRSVKRWVLGLVLGLAMTGMVHLYYLPLLALLTAGFFAWWLLPQRQWWRSSLMWVGAALTLLPFILCFLLIRVTDGYYTLRGSGATGFNYTPWTMQLSSLFRSYEYQTVRFWLEPQAQPPYESVGYLGAFALFGLSIFAVVWAVLPTASRQFRAAWSATSSRKFTGLLLGTAALSLAVSIGTVYELGDGKYLFTNYFSVFFYLQKVSDAVTHFRVLARFSWSFFWAVNLLVLVGVDFWLYHSRWAGRWAVGVGLVVLALLDTRDAFKHYHERQLQNVLVDSYRTADINRLLYSVKPAQYQAILPVPFFHVGTENLELTLDDENNHSMHCYQLALRTNLPLMASKMSRTPPVHVEQLRTLFDANGPAPELKARLVAASKPILVLVDQSYYDGTNQYAAQQGNPKARQLIEAGIDLVNRQHMTLLAESGKLRLYRWDVQ